MTVIPEIMLNNGQRIPQLGFGVFLIPPPQTEAAVTTALQAGYRHIDTAEMYGNEAEVGQAISKSGLSRGEVFVTTKLSNDAHRPDDARRAFDGSLKALGFDYVDLFLIHWPLPTRYDGDFVSTWRTLEEFYRDGRARSIGVSNFQPHHLRRIHTEGEITPAVDQIEVNPYLTQDEVRRFCADHEIAHRGVVAARPRQRAGRSDGGRHRPPAGEDPGPGRASLAHRARRRRLPQVRDPGADQGEHRRLRLRTLRRGRRGDRRAEPEPANRPGPGQVRRRARVTGTGNAGPVPLPQRRPRRRPPGPGFCGQVRLGA